MVDETNDPQRADAEDEAAQHVVDEVTSWNYSAERQTIEAQLDEGLDEAGVSLEGNERERIVDEIDELKEDESRGAPSVRGADVEDGGVS